MPSPETSHANSTKSRPLDGRVVLLAASMLAPILGCGRGSDRASEISDSPASASTNENYQVISGTAKIQDRSIDEYENDPSLTAKCDAMLASMHVLDPVNQPLVASLVRAQVFLEPFVEHSDFEIYLKPGLRGAAANALALASEQMCKYYNRQSINDQSIDPGIKAMPLWLLDTSHQLKLAHSLSDFSFRFVRDESDVLMVIDEAPSHEMAISLGNLRAEVSRVCVELTTTNQAAYSQVAR